MTVAHTVAYNIKIQHIIKLYKSILIKTNNNNNEKEKLTIINGSLCVKDTGY